jgi:hypothetical protein
MILTGPTVTVTSLSKAVKDVGKLICLPGIALSFCLIADIVCSYFVGRNFVFGSHPEQWFTISLVIMPFWISA